MAGLLYLPRIFVYHVENFEKEQAFMNDLIRITYLRLLDLEDSVEKVCKRFEENVILEIGVRNGEGTKSLLEIFPNI